MKLSGDPLTPYTPGSSPRPPNPVQGFLLQQASLTHSALSIPYVIYTTLTKQEEHTLISCPLATILPQEDTRTWALPGLPLQLTHPVQGPDADLGGHQGHGGVRGPQLHALP